VFNHIGSGTTPKTEGDNTFEGNINWIQSGDINGGILKECKHRVSDEIVSKYSALKIYKSPFIIVAMYGASVGNISISMIDACVNQACCVFCESNQSFDYMFYAIKSAKDYLIYMAEGGGQPNISQDKLKCLWLPIPPISEQQSIADYLDTKCTEIDNLISIKQQKIENLKEYKKSIIYEYVTGKKEVEDYDL
jgi:type I restriction enzyme S subunit